MYESKTRCLFSIQDASWRMIKVWVQLPAALILMISVTNYFGFLVYEEKLKLMTASLSLLQVLEDEEEAALEKEDQEREQEVSYPM